MSEKYAVLIGLDWAEEKHQVCWRDTHSGQLHQKTLDSCPEQIHEWIGELLDLYPDQRAAICLEQSRGPLVYALMGYEAVDLYPINPATLAKYRQAFRPSGFKDDPLDAALLLELLERHAEALQLWRADTAETRLLQSLCEDRRKAVEMRKRLSNSLRSKLKEYFPQALKLVGDDLGSELCCAFLMKWPRFEAVAAARASTVRRFYYEHRCRNEQRIQERMELIGASRPLCTDSAVVEAGILWVRTLIEQIRSLRRCIQSYERRIRELFAAHEDRGIFESFPGAGEHLAPRLLTAFGTDRSRYPTAVDAAAYMGVAPVIERSGQHTRTRWRWHCPTFVRQSLVEFAGCSTKPV